jgi:glucose-1-phosphate thymidylyltransferase
LPAGIERVLIISTAQDPPYFQHLLGDGSGWGTELQYAMQPSPDGLAQDFPIGDDFIGKRGSALVPRDNIFYGHVGGSLAGSRQIQDGRMCFRLSCG